MYNKANIIDRFRLDGKTALVTGGSGYYGKQMVIALADQRVVFTLLSSNFTSVSRGSALTELMELTVGT